MQIFYIAIFTGDILITTKPEEHAISGQDVILNCDFTYPEQRPVEHIVKWYRKGVDIPIFMSYDGFRPHTGRGFEGRVELATLAQSRGWKASLRIKQVRGSDEGWYECIGKEKIPKIEYFWVFVFKLFEFWILNSQCICLIVQPNCPKTAAGYF